MIRIRQIKLPIESSNIKEKVAQKLKIKEKDIIEYKINKKSLDARADLIYVYEIDAKINSLIDSLEESSNVSMGYINKRIQQLDSQKNALLAKQTAELRKNKKFYLPEMNYNELSFEDKKILAEILIDKVLLGNKSIEIVWK